MFACVSSISSFKTPLTMHAHALVQSADGQINSFNTRAHGGNAFAVVNVVHRECERFIPWVGTCAL
jgi:hypothetical protein